MRRRETGRLVRDDESAIEKTRRRVIAKNATLRRQDVSAMDENATPEGKTSRSDAKRRVRSVERASGTQNRASAA
jgi:hypothetical protein